MRILLDENIPVDFAAELTGHQVDTVTGLRWAGVRNGELLRRASEGYDVLVTMDRNVEYQQNIRAFPIAILVLRAVSNRLIHLRPLAPAILDLLPTLAPGQLRRVGG